MKKLVALLLCVATIISARIDTSKEKLLICGVCKNVRRYLPNMIRKIEQLGSNFADYRVLIYENNSEDQSGTALQQWAAQNNRVRVISEQVSYEELVSRVKSRALRDKAPCRMEMIAYARNQVLSLAMDAQYDDYNYLVMTDLDFGRGWDPRGVLTCFESNQEWDALLANSLTGRTYYDRYAYRDETFPLGPELIGEEFWADVHRKPFSIAPNHPLKKVYSAFGGIGVYKRSALRGCQYDGYVTPALTEFYRKIVYRDINTNNRQYGVYRGVIKSEPTSSPITYQANCGYDGPVCCEHSTLHAQMILNGHNKLFINPQMLCFY